MKNIYIILQIVMMSSLLQAEEAWVEKLEKISFSQLMKDAEEYSWIGDKDIRHKLIGLKKELSNCELKDEQSAIDHVDNLVIKDGKSSVFSKCELTHTDKQHFVWEVRCYSAITYPMGTPSVIYWITAKDGSLHSKWAAPDDPRIERVKIFNQGDQLEVSPK